MRSTWKSVRRILASVLSAMIMINIFSGTGTTVASAAADLNKLVTIQVETYENAVVEAFAGIDKITDFTNAIPFGNEETIEFTIIPNAGYRLGEVRLTERDMAAIKEWDSLDTDLVCSVDSSGSLSYKLTIAKAVFTDKTDGILSITTEEISTEKKENFTELGLSLTGVKTYTENVDNCENFYLKSGENANLFWLDPAATELFSTSLSQTGAFADFVDLGNSTTNEISKIMVLKTDADVILPDVIREYTLNTTFKIVQDSYAQGDLEVKISEDDLYIKKGTAAVDISGAARKIAGGAALKCVVYTEKTATEDEIIEAAFAATLPAGFKKIDTFGADGSFTILNYDITGITDSRSIYFYAVDKGSNVSTATEVKITVDVNVPVISERNVAGTITEHSFGAFVKGELIVTVSAEDAETGIGSIQLFANGSEVLSDEAGTDSNGVFSRTFTVKLSDGETVQDIYAIVTDKAGNETEKSYLEDSQGEYLSYVFDSGSPEFTLSENDDSAFYVVNETAENTYTIYGMDYEAVFKAEVSDIDSGLASVLSSGNVTISGLRDDYSNEQIDNDTAEVTAASGETFVITVMDNAGNTLSKTYTYQQDAAAPVVDDMSVTSVGIKYAKWGNISKNSMTLTITASDDTTGVQKAEIYINGGEEPCGEAVFTDGKATFHLTENEFKATGTLSAAVYDGVGNVTEDIKLTDYPANGYQSDDIHISSDAAVYNPMITIDLESVPQQQIKMLGDQYWIKEAKDGVSIDYTVKDGTNDDGFGLMEVSEDGAVRDRSFSLTDTVIHDRKYTWTKDIEWISENQGEQKILVDAKTWAGFENSEQKNIFFDTKKPQITGFIISENESTADKLLRILSFGNYTRTTLEIMVFASDGEDGSGIEKMVLYVDGKSYAESADLSSTNDGKSTVFTITRSGTSSIERISAVAADRVGHEAKEIDLGPDNTRTDTNKVIQIGKFIFDEDSNDAEPAINVKLTGNQLQKEDIIYCGETSAVLDVTVSDKDTGIYNAVVEKDGQTILADANGKQIGNGYKDLKAETKSDTFHLICEEINTLKVMATDLAGNVKSAEYRYMIDTHAPVISSIEFEPLGAAGSVTGVGTADEETPAVIETDYGYFFSSDTNVTIRANDGENGVGVGSITYCIRDINGNYVTPIQTVNTVDNTIQFMVAAGLKGNIFAKSTDQLGNRGTDYVTPEGVIIETQSQHNESRHTEISIPTTSINDKNQNPLYASSVNINFVVTDTVNGIDSVEWSVLSPYDTGQNQNGSLTIDTFGNLSASDWNVTSRERNLVTNIQKTIQVSNNSNHIVILLKMTDRAGNTSEETKIISIDMSQPKIEITFDTTEEDGFYNRERIATFTITERNFDAEKVVVNIRNTENAIPGLSEWNTIEDSQNPDQTTHTATVIFAADGDYSILAEMADTVGNQAQSEESEEFTVDMTIPVIEVSYDTNQAINENYYAAERTATITVTEHNFSEEGILVTGTATDNEEAISFPSVSAWSSSGDVHTATITCNTDGFYSFTVDGSDESDNEAVQFVSEEYYVDMTEPTIEISGIETYSANNAKVAPVISLMDTNYDENGVQITLNGANRGNTEIVGSYSAQSNGQTFLFQDFEYEQDMDDIYTLAVNLKDRAGNETMQEITFSVNRFGSVYVFDHTLKDITGRYVQEEIDVKITETNVNRLKHDSIQIVLDKNGTPETLEENQDYSVHELGGDSQWSQYEYVLDKKLFSGDGRYIISFYSEDEAGNINENNAESKEAEITFGVDKTAPVIIPVDITEGAQYNLDKKTAAVTVNDNLVLEDVAVYLNGSNLEYVQNGENLTFDIPSADRTHSVAVVARDAAGNTQEREINNILVTTNTFIRWYNNKPLFVGSIAGVAGVSGAGAAGAVFFKSGRIKIKRRRK